MSSTDNKRRHPRISIILKVDYASGEDFLADYTCNASDTGLFIATDRAFSPGDVLDFSLSFPGLLPPIQCRAEVRWRKGPDPAQGADQIPGIGVVLIFETDAERKRIEDLVTRLRQAHQPSPAPSAPSVPFLALLAEDNPLVREMLRFAVRKYHSSQIPKARVLEVFEAEDGQRGWEHISQRKFDIAIVDYFMPVMDGGQLIRKIRGQTDMAGLPIIAVSVGGDEVRREVYAAGANLFLDKPLVLNQLIDSMQRLLQLDRKG